MFVLLWMNRLIYILYLCACVCVCACVRAYVRAHVHGSCVTGVTTSQCGTYVDLQQVGGVR